MELYLLGVLISFIVLVLLFIFSIKYEEFILEPWKIKDIILYSLFIPWFSWIFVFVLVSLIFVSIYFYFEDNNKKEQDEL